MQNYIMYRLLSATPKAIAQYFKLVCSQGTLDDALDIDISSIIYHDSRFWSFSFIILFHPCHRYPRLW